MTVPDGWKLVPIEPTDEMLLAVRYVIERPYFGGNYARMFKERHAHAAMLKVAPAAPVAAPAPSEWISVTDRLPQDDCKVLVASWRYITGEQRVTSACWSHGLSAFDKRDVTHWMPLPAAPVTP